MTPKSKLYELLNKRLPVTLFHKYTQGSKAYYYIILKNVLQLKIQLIDDVYVIDEITCLTKAYMRPFYDTLVDIFSKQEELTVIVSMCTSANVLKPACMEAGMPKVSTDDRYCTVPKEVYAKLVTLADNELSNVDTGYYLLSVSNDTNNHRLPFIGQTEQLEQVAKIIRNSVSGVNIVTSSDTELDITVSNGSSTFSFLVSLIEGKIVIRNLFSDNYATINFVQLTRLLDVFEKFLEVNPTVLITDVRAAELYRLCEAREYLHIQEGTKLFHSTLFNQIHCGYGTYRITTAYRITS